METFLAVLLLGVPLFFGELYSRYEYDQKFVENIDCWRVGKITSLIFLGSYSFYIFNVGSDAIAYGLEDWLFYFLEPGIATTLVVYSRPASEILVHYDLFKSVSIHEDAAFLLGWGMLIYVYWSVLLYSL